MFLRFFRPVLLLSVLAVLSVLPLLTVSFAPLDRIPVTSSGSASVPLFNAWTILWNTIGVECGFQGWWDAPIFFPERQCFAFSEPMLLTAVLQPLVRLSNSLALPYNCWLAGNLFLNGVTAALLLSRGGCRFWSSAAAGCAMTLHPLLQTQLEVLQLACLWPSFWLLAALLRLAAVAEDSTKVRRHRRVAIGEAAAAVVCLPLTCIHHTLFMGVLLLAAGWTLIPWGAVRRWVWLVCQVAVAASPVAALVLWPVQRVLDANGFERRAETVAVLSAIPADYLRVPEQSIFSVSGDKGGRPWNPGPGWIRVLLAVIGVSEAFRRRSADNISGRLVLLLAVLAVSAWLLSLGVYLQLGSWNIWAFLCAWLPGVAQVRSAFRFALFFQAAVILLAGAGLEYLPGIFRRSVPGLRQWQNLPAMIMGILLAFEMRSARLQTVDVPRPDEISGWASFLQNSAAAEEGVLILPYVQGHAPDDFEQTVRWMIQSTAAGLKIANGYSGFFPASHFELQRLLGREGLSSSVTGTLRDRGIRWIVATDAETMAMAVGRGELLQEWRSADGMAAVFRLTDAGKAKIPATTP